MPTSPRSASVARPREVPDGGCVRSRRRPAARTPSATVFHCGSRPLPTGHRGGFVHRLPTLADTAADSSPARDGRIHADLEFPLSRWSRDLPPQHRRLRRPCIGLASDRDAPHLRPTLNFSSTERRSAPQDRPVAVRRGLGEPIIEGRDGRAGLRGREQDTTVRHPQPGTRAQVRETDSGVGGKRQLVHLEVAKCRPGRLEATVPERERPVPPPT